MLTECSDSPLQTWRHASRVAPTTCALAWCMSLKTGSSSVPRPCVGSHAARRRAGPGDRVDQRPGRGRSRSASSVAIGASTRLRPSSTPSSSASRIVRSTRTGDIGWRGPEVVVGERRVEDDRRGPGALHVADVTPARRRSVPRTMLNMFSCRARSLNTFNERLAHDDHVDWRPQPSGCRWAGCSARWPARSTRGRPVRRPPSRPRRPPAAHNNGLASILYLVVGGPWSAGSAGWRSDCRRRCR